MKLNNSRGMALVVVMVVIIMLTIIAGFVANLGYNQRRLLDVASGHRIRVYYRAQAGVVDALWRIRVNYLTNFTVPGNTAAYSLDVDSDGINDTTVTIGAANAAGVRAINATGLDV